MEISPNLPESSGADDKKESGSKKKKSAEAIGAFVVEPKPSAESSKSESIFSRLSGVEDKSKDVDAGLTEHANESIEEVQPELLSSAEEQYIETQLILNEQLPPPSEYEEQSEEESLAATSAVEKFRERIVNDGETSNRAFTETIAEIKTPPAPELETTSLQEQTISLRSAEPTEAPALVFTRTREVQTLPETSFSKTSKEQKNNAPLVTGSIVRDLVSRRAEQSKAEKKFVPTQHKLEKEVERLHTELVTKENIIRETAILSVRHEPITKRTPNHEFATTNTPDTSHGAPRPERLGKAVVTAEARQDTRPEVIKNFKEKDIHTLTRNELLEVSAKIIVEGTSLKQIYENRLVGEKGLRRLVIEFMRGGNIRRALKREIMEKEIDFERDPLVRDRARINASSTSNSLDELIKKVDSLPGSDTAEMAVLKARAAHEAKVMRKRQKQRHQADVSLLTIIALLITAIVILLMSR